MTEIKLNLTLVFIRIRGFPSFIKPQTTHGAQQRGQGSSCPRVLQCYPEGEALSPGHIIMVMSAHDVLT